MTSTAAILNGLSDLRNEVNQMGDRRAQDLLCKTFRFLHARLSEPRERVRAGMGGGIA